MRVEVSISIFFTIIGFALARPQVPFGIADGFIHDHIHPNPYEFGYGVVDPFTGNDFGHSEASDGVGNVQGRYFVLLPDGRRQIVDYIADHHGYQAQVSYEGAAQHPQLVGGPVAGPFFKRK